MRRKTSGAQRTAPRASMPPTQDNPGGQHRQRGGHALDERATGGADGIVAGLEVGGGEAGSRAHARGLADGPSRSIFRGRARPPWPQTGDAARAARASSTAEGSTRPSPRMATSRSRAARIRPRPAAATASAHTSRSLSPSSRRISRQARSWPRRARATRACQARASRRRPSSPPKARRSRPARAAERPKPRPHSVDGGGLVLAIAGPQRAQRHVDQDGARALFAVGSVGRAGCAEHHGAGDAHLGRRVPEERAGPGEDPRVGRAGIGGGRPFFAIVVVVSSAELVGHAERDVADEGVVVVGRVEERLHRRLARGRHARERHHRLEAHLGPLVAEGAPEPLGGAGIADLAEGGDGHLPDQGVVVLDGEEQLREGPRPRPRRRAPWPRPRAPGRWRPASALSAGRGRPARGRLRRRFPRRDGRGPPDRAPGAALHLRLSRRRGPRAGRPRAFAGAGWRRT